MTPAAIINPFYAARQSSRISHSETRPVYARLPRAPRNASPVPHLTSLYHRHDRGPWGDQSFPGNCSGHLIHDLLSYFKPESALDPMPGSGTAGAVCRDLGIPCVEFDIRKGQDACDPATFAGLQPVPFIWAHPPYARQKRYCSDPRDLSQAPSFAVFLERYGQFLANCAAVLQPGGVLCVLMGDYTDLEWGFLPLTYWTKHLAFAAGLTQCATDIVRFSHGASSSRKVYRSSFIPGLHDTCCLFSKPVSIGSGS